MGNKTVNSEYLKVYVDFKKSEKPTVEIDKDGNVKILAGKLSVGGIK